MQNKLKRILFVEKQFRLRMALAAILIGLTIFTNILTAATKRSLTLAKAEKELVMSIPILEKLFFSKATREEKVKIAFTEGKLILEGTYEKDSVPYALINGTILAKGDMIGDYEIMHIDYGVAILDNRKTKERKILQFFKYE